MKIIEFIPCTSPKGYTMGIVVLKKWFGLRVESREVFKESWSSYWKWMDSGNFVDGCSAISRFERAQKARLAKKEMQ